MRKLTELFLRKDEQASKGENTGDIYIYRSKKEISTILITTLGLSADSLEEVIVTTKRRLLGKRDRLVYLTDISDFTMFRRHGVFFEYLPPLSEQRLHAADMPWQAYLRERWGLLLAKWRPRQVLAYGMNIESFLAAAPAAVRTTSDITMS